MSEPSSSSSSSSSPLVEAVISYQWKAVPKSRRFYNIRASNLAQALKCVALQCSGPFASIFVRRNKANIDLSGSLEYPNEFSLESGDVMKITLGGPILTLQYELSEYIIPRQSLSYLTYKGLGLHVFEFTVDKSGPFPSKFLLDGDDPKRFKEGEAPLPDDEDHVFRVTEGMVAPSSSSGLKRPLDFSSKRPKKRVLSLNQIQTNIKAFCDQIVKNDMPPVENLLSALRDEFHPFIKSPFPTFQSEGRKIFYPQMISSPAAERYISDLIEVTKAEQEPIVLAAALPSGTGKTHLAYEAGKSQSLVILCTLGNGGDTMNPIWRSLNQKLASISQHDANRCNLAEDYVSILLLCYFEIACDVLDIALSLSSDSPCIHELLLRFQRNGMFDTLVDELFICHSENFHVEQSLGSDYLASMKSLVESRVVSHVQRFTRRFFFCLDEAGYLFEERNRFPDLFLSHHPETSSQPRSLYYFVTWFLEGFSTRCNTSGLKNLVYITGTNFSLRTSLEPRNHSASRSRVQEVPSLPLLDTGQMLDLISQYFTDPVVSLFLPQGRLHDTLNLCVGRPLNFVVIVLEPLCSLRHNGANLDDFASKLSFRMATRMANRVNLLQDRFLNAFSDLKQLLEAMWVALFMNNGILHIGGDEILKKLILRSPFVCKLDAEVDLKLEPLSYNALIHTMQQYSVKEVLESLVCFVLNSVGVHGKFVENVLALHLAVSVYKISANNPVYLFQLLTPFGVVDCSPNLIVNCSRLVKVPPGHQSPFEFFYQSGSLDSSVILFNLPDKMGLDLCFVVFDTNLKQHRIVGIQVKNQASSTFRDSIITLSPGFQWLANTHRLCLLNRSALCDCSFSGLPSERIMFENFFLNHPDLSSTWVRIIASRRESTPRLCESLNAYNTSHASSPIFIMNLKSDWLPDSCKALIPVAPSSMDVPDGDFNTVCRYVELDELDARVFTELFPVSVSPSRTLTLCAATTTYLNADRLALPRWRDHSDSLKDILSQQGKQAPSTDDEI